MKPAKALLLLVALTAYAKAASLPAFDIERRALDPTRKVQRVFLALPAGPGEDMPVSLKAALRCGARAIPVLSEYPLPWSDGRRALCLSWRTGEESRTGDRLRVTLSPGRRARLPGVPGVNLFPDPDLARPVHAGEGTARVDAWHFGASGKARKYERKAAVAERAPGEGPALRVRPSRAGNWSVWFYRRPNFAVTPGRRYVFALSYATAKDMYGMLQVHFSVAGTNRPLKGVRYGLSRKPWVYHGSARWRRRRVVFTAPERSGGAMVYAKVSSPGVLWLRDFAVAPVYRPAFDVEAVDQEYGLAERRARFKVTANLADESLLPACGSPPKGCEVWALRSWPKAPRFRVTVAAGWRETPRAAPVSSRGIVEVPLPGRPGDFAVTFRFADPKGRLFAVIPRPIRVRAGVLDLKGGAP